MLMADGYAVEAQVHEWVGSWDRPEELRFQQTYNSDDGLLARTDLVRLLDDGRIDLYEVKSSTSLKSQLGNHVEDAAFQVIATERAGVKVRNVYVIHVDKTYVRDGDIDPSKLLTVVDVSDQVREMIDYVIPDIAKAQTFLGLDAIDETGCDCRFKGSVSNHCATFDHFNTDIPDQSIYLLPRLSAKKTKVFVDEGRLALSRIGEDEASPTQRPVLQAAKQGAPVINEDGILGFLESLEWPLYFYDYETFKSAIPISDGIRAHQQVPVQVSIHKLDADGTITHFEYQCRASGQQGGLVEFMDQSIGSDGSLVSWNKSFEMTCNRDLAAQFPRCATTLNDMNDRTVDLMDVFKRDYVDIGFEGSTSIKKVLPVVCPHLSYDGMAVSDGAGAMAAWLSTTEEPNPERKQVMEQDLLKYCKLDTHAMVETHKFLCDLVGGSA